MSNFIKGQFRRKIYSSDAGYIIGIFKVLETNYPEVEDYLDRTITFTGYFHELNEVDTYLFYGDLVEHERFGEQWQVSSYERCLPEEKDSIVEFLTSGLFKGIGEKKAKRIVDTLGKDTLKVIIENPKSMILIPTITQKNIDLLHEKMIEYEASYETILALGEYGFSTRDSMQLYYYYKEKTLEVIKDNIYDVIGRTNTLTFKKVDFIALKNKVEKDALIRIKAAIMFMLSELENSLGHCYFKKEEIVSFLYRIIDIHVDLEIIEKALEELELNLDIIIDDEKYYRKETYEAETTIAIRFRLLTRQKDLVEEKIDSEIENLEESFSIKYNEEQKEAIKNSILKKALIITGGPGTGKTTIMKAIIELYSHMNKYNYLDMESKVALLAPTGRAAKRISEATSYKASTIHRFLKWNKDNNSFQVNEYNKSKVEFVIIDEASMIDCHLMNSLLKGLSVNTKIILIGDYEQLPSVGPGEVLKDLIDSEVLNVSTLGKLYRQGKDSNIITFAYDIRVANTESTSFNQDEDLTFIECKKDDVIGHIEEISASYQDLADKEFQVLAPMYKTQNGIDNINISLQSIFNPKKKTKKEIVIGDFVYREGDKVIQLTNMPDDNIYNGDIGTIKKIETGRKKEILIDFDGNVVKYTASLFFNFKLAYAISIHKAQGSEFNVVIIPVVRGFNKMLYRRLIYTAVTRCKEKLYLIGEKEALKFAILNNKENNRRTTIKDFLVHGIKKEI